ncbi:MAG: hypothetical protein QOG63_1177 [Thermoleophilaceae bacterium]|nr:hypothetical protein [Thermoleophilaceae bacterium]
MAKRRHALQLWLIAGAIVALAALVAFAITALHGHADRARRAQIVLSDINAEAQRINRVEWEAEAKRRVSPALQAEHRAVSARIDGLLIAYARYSPTDGPQLRAEAERYIAVVNRQLTLLGDGRLAASHRVDKREVDPAFERLQHRLELIDVAEGKTAATAANSADLGVTASLLLAALVLIAALWRLDRIRTNASRKLNQTLEDQARHDALTGLPNRRKLLVDLENALRRAAAGEHVVLVLCDLDGFKAYNDTFGHPEGDLLLARLSKKLAQTAAPHGTAYRLGGDEFCALLNVHDDDLEAALAACHAALCESGSGFSIRASIGSVTLAVEASDSATALRLADERMYAQKGTQGSSVRQQLRDLIMRILAEQDPELSDHVRDVARLAAGVGRRCALNDSQVANLVRAAELHDVGKVAIPDSILHKAGPLDVHEQQFIRRHTLIGESILSAAPALAEVGQLVRSSHERYDGTGYPDGLREEEIPLSSRIIFACDSFDAMTTDRPYRRAMTEGDALIELRDCSSTQFDPVVVDALAAELAALRATRKLRVSELRALEPVSPA